RGHVLEVIVIFLGLVRSGLTQHADGGRRCMEDVDVKTLGNSPRPSGIGIGGNAFIDNAGSSQRERSVNNIGVAGDPTDVRHAPVNIGWITGHSYIVYGPLA